MRQVNELITNAITFANNIQDALDQGNYYIVHELIDNLLAQNETCSNLISGATFTINDPDDGLSTDNSLLHVAIRARVEPNTIDALLPLTHNNSVIVHVNSNDLTPIKYAEKYFRADDHVMDLRDIIFDYHYYSAHNYDQYLTQLVRLEVQEGHIVDNRIIAIDIGPMVFRDEARSLFNSSHGIAMDIEAFIANSQCNDAVFETRGTTIIFQCNNNIELLAVESDQLGDLN